MNSITKHLRLTLLTCLLLTACNQPDELLDKKDLEALKNCSENGLEYFINSDLSKYYNSVFEYQFNEIKSQSFFDSFWTSERKCELNNGKKIVTFAYLSKGDKKLTHISMGMHTLFVLFDSQDKPLKWTDITCPIADDVGGISKVILENNYLYAECITRGSYGVMSGHTYGASELHRINLSNFQNEIIWQMEWKKQKGDFEIISETYFVSENELSDAIKMRTRRL